MRGGPGAPRVGACARSCGRGPPSPPDSFSYVYRRWVRGRYRPRPLFRHPPPLCSPLGRHPQMRVALGAGCVAGVSRSRRGRCGVKSSSVWSVVQFASSLGPHSYRRGCRLSALPLSGSCKGNTPCAIRHAAVAALRHRGWYLFYRLPHCAATAALRCFPSVQLPEVCQWGAPSDCQTDYDLIYRLPHR